MYLCRIFLLIIKKLSSVLLDIFLTYFHWSNGFSSCLELNNPHVTSASWSMSHRSITINRWYDDDCKSHHRQLCHGLSHNPTSYPILNNSYCNALHRKKLLFISWRRCESCVALCFSPKTFDATSFLASQISPLILTPVYVHPYDCPLQCPRALSCPSHLLPLDTLIPVLL